MTTKLPADIQPGDITVGSAYGMTSVSRALVVIPYVGGQTVLIKWQSVALYTGGSEISYTYQHTYPADFELPIFSAREILRVIAPNAWLPGETGPAFPPPDPYDVILAAHSDEGIRREDELCANYGTRYEYECPCSQCVNACDCGRGDGCDCRETMQRDLEFNIHRSIDNDPPDDDPYDLTRARIEVEEYER